MKTVLIKTFALVFMAGCAAQSPTQSSYLPGLGEMMTQLSYRHGKLWFAGKVKNWELAAYELDEIQEGFEDTGNFHPSHHEVKAIPEQIARYMATPIQQTGLAIKAKSSPAFADGYDAITAGCNACHKANGFGFNVLVRPAYNPFANQQFEPNAP